MRWRSSAPWVILGVTCLSMIAVAALVADRAARTELRRLMDIDLKGKTVTRTMPSGRRFRVSAEFEKHDREQAVREQRAILDALERLDREGAFDPPPGEDP